MTKIVVILMENIVLIVLVAGFALVYFKKTEVRNENSQELLNKTDEIT